MKKYYQFGYDLGLFIYWRRVSTPAFAEKIAPLLLDPGQFETITPNELLPFFVQDFIVRDGWRLYRAVPLESLNEGDD